MKELILIRKVTNGFIVEEPDARYLAGISPNSPHVYQTFEALVTHLRAAFAAPVQKAFEEMPQTGGCL